MQNTGCAVALLLALSITACGENQVSNKLDKQKALLLNSEIQGVMAFGWQGAFGKEIKNNLIENGKAVFIDAQHLLAKYLPISTPVYEFNRIDGLKHISVEDLEAALENNISKNKRSLANRDNAFFVTDICITENILEGLTVIPLGFSDNGRNYVLMAKKMRGQVNGCE